MQFITNDFEVLNAYAKVKLINLFALPEKFKLITMQSSYELRSVKDWIRFIWGFDIYINNVPLLKTFTLINILIVLLLLTF